MCVCARFGDLCVCVWGGGLGLGREGEKKEKKKTPGKIRGGHKELIWGRSGTLKDLRAREEEIAQHTTLTQGEETKRKLHQRLWHK